VFSLANVRKCGPEGRGWLERPSPLYLDCLSKRFAYPRGTCGCIEPSGIQINPTTQANQPGLIQLVRFLVVELIYLDLNSKFDIGVVFMTNYSFSER
jgi:hypothetical protein